MYRVTKMERVGVKHAQRVRHRMEVFTSILTRTSCGSSTKKFVWHHILRRMEEGRIHKVVTE